MSAAPMGFAVRRIPTGTVFHHVTRAKHIGTSLYFGASAANRYDAPDRSYGVMYLAEELEVAVLESVFHKAKWTERKKRLLTRAELNDMVVRLVRTEAELVVADVFGNPTITRSLGYNRAQMFSRRYGPTQRISALVRNERDAANLPAFDGIVYPSRNAISGECLAAFDHAAMRLRLVHDAPLSTHIDWKAFVKNHGVVVA